MLSSDEEQLDRIEAKLDAVEVSVAALIAALAEDDADDRPTHDLEGNAIPARRTDDGEL